MANIRIDLCGEPTDGQQVTFKAPCDCTAVTGIKAYYPNGGDEKASMTFVMKDAHGNNLNGVGNLFLSGAFVHAILDVTNKFAYLQNADTNQYLEGKINPVNNLTSTETGKPLSAAMGKELKDSIDALPSLELISNAYSSEESITYEVDNYEPGIYLFTKVCLNGTGSSKEGVGYMGVVHTYLMKTTSTPVQVFPKTTILVNQQDSNSNSLLDIDVDGNVVLNGNCGGSYKYQAYCYKLA